MGIDFLFKYYRAVAAFMGRGKAEQAFQINNDYDGKATFSYYEAFTDIFGWNENNANLLVKAYFGDAGAISVLNDMTENNDNEVNSLLSSSSLNESQKAAVRNAINYPLSIIKGPPGTGKT